METRAENHQDVLRAAGAARVTRWAARDAALIPLFEKAHCRLDLWPRPPSKACVRAAPVHPTYEKQRALGHVVLRRGHCDPRSMPHLAFPPERKQETTSFTTVMEPGLDLDLVEIESECSENLETDAEHDKKFNFL